MTEEEYIVVNHLTKIRTIMMLLGQITEDELGIKEMAKIAWDAEEKLAERVESFFAESAK